MTIHATSRFDAALGSLLGACIGDAAGAVLEFMGCAPTAADVDHALTMPGGGVWQVAPGQVTDDCELSICLARALAQSQAFDLEIIANSYAAWIESKPFDIGTTTINGLGYFTFGKRTPSHATGMTRAAAQHSIASKSNGSLMRASPLGIWGNRHSASEIADFARQDSCLSHPNECCWQAVACYAIAIAHLINNLGDRLGAFACAKTWADQHANAEIQQWLTDAADTVDIAYAPQIGFVRIGFTHAFRHLLLGTSYMDALRETLLGGGDTDTNACIVSGLVGAAWGADAIPDAMKNAVLNCDTTMGQARPAFLHANQVPILVEGMLTVTAQG